MEYYFASSHTPEEVIDELALLYSFASSQCKIIDSLMASPSQEGKVNASPTDIQGLVTAATVIEKTRRRLISLNISLFLH